MRNSGTLAWPKKTKLVWIGGDQLTNAESIEVPVSGILSHLIRFGGMTWSVRLLILFNLV